MPYWATTGRRWNGFRRRRTRAFPAIPSTTAIPDLAGLRKDPAFIAFMSKLRAQWERYREPMTA